MAEFNYKNIIKNFSRSRGKDKSKIEFNVYRDWSVLLVIFFIFLIFIAVVNMYLFTVINKEEIFAKEISGDEEIEMLNVENLKSIMEFFNKREENFNKLIEQKPDIVDPSL